jgi:hypothetical protein
MQYLQRRFRWFSRFHSDAPKSHRIFGKVLAVLGLTLVSCGPDSSTVHELSWDSNLEPNIQEYRVYSCDDSVCTDRDLLLGIVQHVDGQDRQRILLPNLNRWYVVYAVNANGQMSDPSETLRCIC